MELFKNIRLKMGMSFLNKRIARTKRKIHYSHFGKVRKIGIVWDALRQEDLTSLSKFCQKMQERDIEVKIISFFPGKNLPDQYTAVRYLTFLKRKDLNLFYHPVSAETINFISNRFDVLIDMNFKKMFPLHYISSLSNAAFKVGLSEPESADTPFELMMELKRPVAIDNYLNQIITYLEMINSGTEKTVNK
jgi:hypothetical protein